MSLEGFTKPASPDAMPFEEFEPPPQVGMLGKRAYVLKALYLAERLGITLSQALEQMPDDLPDEPELKSEFQEFALGFVVGAEVKDEINGRISELAKHKSTDGTPLLGKLILQMAMIEMRCFPDTPPEVITSQAVKLATIFGSELMPSFINSVLRIYVKSY